MKLNGSSVRTLKFSHYIRFFTISDLIVNNFHRIYILNLIFSKKFFYQFHKIQRLFSFLEDFVKIPVISFSKAENPEIWQHWVLQLCSFRRQAAPDHDTTEDENKTLSGMKYFPSWTLDSRSLLWKRCSKYFAVCGTESNIAFDEWHHELCTRIHSLEFILRCVIDF